MTSAYLKPVDKFAMVAMNALINKYDKITPDYKAHSYKSYMYAKAMLSVGKVKDTMSPRD